MTRRKLGLLPFLIGLVVTVATLLATTDLHREPFRYGGDARVYGAPLSFYYTVSPGPDQALMAAQVWCIHSATCMDGFWFTTERGPFMPVPFLVDYALWTAASGVAVSVVATAGFVRRRLRQ